MPFILQGSQIDTRPCDNRQEQISALVKHSDEWNIQAHSIISKLYQFLREMTNVPLISDCVDYPELAKAGVVPFTLSLLVKKGHLITSVSCFCS